MLWSIFTAEQQLRGVPIDIKEFWGDQYVYISIITVMEREVCKKLNTTLEEVELMINSTTKDIEEQVSIITHSVWPERS